MLNQIKRLAAFQNPEFFKKQGLRLPTALTPRVISCAEDHPRHVSLPRGCLDDLHSLLGGHAVKLDLEDEGPTLGMSFVSRLTPQQEEAAQVLLAHDTGVFVAPPGSGKTVVASHSWTRGWSSCLCISASIRERSVESEGESESRTGTWTSR